MSIDTRASASSLMDTFICKPIGKAMTNPISLALMITAIIMLIVIYTYDSKHKLRTALRVFGVALFFLFVNNHIILADMHGAQLNTDQRNILDSVSGGDGLTPNESLVVPSKNIIAGDDGASA